MHNAGTRIAHLARLVEDAKKQPTRTHRIPWRGRFEDFPVVKIRTEWLCYRIDNGRTRRAQLQYLQDHPGLSPNFFKDPESEQVQLAQGEILRAMIGDMNLYNYLKQEGQADPGIATYDGYLVNGNRRLCALREMQEQWMDVIVLPRCEKQEIYELELTLQMAPETKADYSWIDELLQIQEGLETFGESPVQIGNRMRLTEEEVLGLRRRLTLVDAYLKFQNVEGQYHRINDKTKLAFEELQKRLESSAAKSLTEEQRQYYSELAFGHISEAAKAMSEGALYEKLRTLWKAFTDDPHGFIRTWNAALQDDAASQPDVAAVETSVTIASTETPTKEDKLQVGNSDAMVGKVAPQEPSAEAAKTDGLQMPYADSEAEDLFGALNDITEEQPAGADLVSEGLSLIRSHKDDLKSLVSASKATVDDIEQRKAEAEAVRKPVEAMKKIERMALSIDVEAALDRAAERFDTGAFVALIERVENRLKQLREQAKKQIGKS